MILKGMKRFNEINIKYVFHSGFIFTYSLKESDEISNDNYLNLTL